MESKTVYFFHFGLNKQTVSSYCFSSSIIIRPTPFKSSKQQFKNMPTPLKSSKQQFTCLLASHTRAAYSFNRFLQIRCLGLFPFSLYTVFHEWREESMKYIDSNNNWSMGSAHTQVIFYLSTQTPKLDVLLLVFLFIFCLYSQNKNKSHNF